MKNSTDHTYLRYYCDGLAVECLSGLVKAELNSSDADIFQSI